MRKDKTNKSTNQNFESFMKLLNNETLYAEFLENSFPGIESKTDLINLISVMLSDNPDAAIIAREVLYTLIKQNINCLDLGILGNNCDSQGNVKLTSKKRQDAFFDYKGSQQIFYMGNITDEMTEFENHFEMMDTFCDVQRDGSHLLDFTSDSAVQDFLNFYKYSKNTFWLKSVLLFICMC